MLFDETERYFDDTDERYFQQGDIVLAPAATFDANPPDSIAAPAQAGVPITRQFWAEDLGKLTTGTASLVPAIVVSHDCSLDKEFNRRYEQLRASGVPRAAAIEEAGSDRSLDRFLVVSPIVPFTDAAPSGPDQLVQNKVIGFFPVCESVARSIDAGVADLSAPTTVSREVVVARLGILSESARDTLRYALARFWIYRAPKLTLEIEAAVGKRIKFAEVVGGDQVGIVLTMDDGTTVNLVQAPDLPGQGGPQRPSIL